MKQIIWTGLLLVALTGLFAQQPSGKDFQKFNPRFEVFTLPGGALGNSVQGIVQDSTGFLWFGSQGGLHRYDGKNIVTYRHDPANSNSLASDYCESVFLDSRGVLWLPHYKTGGLTSFDPSTETFTRYSHDPNNPGSLSSNSNSIVAEDREGHIWVGGDGGLDRLDRKTGKFKHFYNDPNDPHSLSYNQVRGLYVDRQGTLWVGTNIFFNPKGPDGGLNRYDPKTESFTRYLHDPRNPKSISDNRVRAIFEDSKGNFWVGTDSDGLNLMDREKGTFTRLSHDPADQGKLSRPYVSGTTPHNEPVESHVSSIIEDQDGRIWIAGFPGGINVYDPLSGITRHFEAGKNKGDLTVNYFWQTYQTSDGVIWLVTGGNAKKIYKVNEQDERFSFFNWENAGIELGGVATSIAKEVDGNIWIGFGLAPPELIRHDRKTGKTFPVLYQAEVDGLSIQYIENLSFDRNGNLWIGAQNGWLKKDAKSGKFRHYRADLIFDRIRPPVEDRNGFLWIPNNGQGLGRLDPRTGAYTSFRHDATNSESIGGNSVMSVLQDAQGNIWASGGDYQAATAEPPFLDRLNADGKSFSHFMKKGEKGSVSNLTLDKQGNFWFLDQVGSLVHLNTADGTLRKFRSPNINMIRISGTSGIVMAMGKDERIWLYDGNSLFLFDPKTEQFHSWVDSHGVRSIGTNNSPFHLAFDGEILIAGDKGFLSFYPEKIATPKKRMPDLHVTAFKLLGNPILPGDTDCQQCILKKPIWKTSKIQLEYDQNMFSFSIACFDYHDPAAVQIEFMLEGYDQLGWRKDLQQGETPAYVNVPVGEYTFRVRGADSQGNWNMEGISLQITILPPWWRTWWAYVAYVLLALLALRIFSKYRERHLRAEKEKLEMTVDKRTQELVIEKEKAQASEKAKHQFLANMSHEIRTPMNAIKGMTDILIRRHPKEDQKEYLNGIKQSSDSLLVIINDILDISKIEAGKLELEQEPFSVNELVNNVHTIMQFKAEEKGLSLMKDIPSEELFVQGDSTRLRQILINLIGNAIKFTEKGMVTTTIKQEQVGEKMNLHFTVSDTGIGIDQSSIAKIFESFEQAYSDTTRRFGGTGLGLSISKKLVELHGGRIWVESEKGKGSQFYFVIPYALAENKTEVIPANEIQTNAADAIKGIRVLLVEDNAFNIVVAQEELEDAIEGVHVEVAENGIIAVEKLKISTFDVILMDVQMPVMNGFEATRAIRNLDKDKAATPIIAMTANVLKEEVDLCYQAGMDDFIGKPFDTNELLNKIFNLIHKYHE